MSDKKKPRRGPGEGSIKKITLKSGKTAYRAWLTVGYRLNKQGTRTPIRRSVQHRKQQVVLERLTLLREKYRADLDLAAEVEMRCATLFEKWLTHYAATERPKPKQNTITAYRWATARVLRQLGDPLVAKVTPLQLQETLNRLAAELKNLNTLRVVMDGAFNQAVLWRIRPDNPAADLKLPRGKNEEHTPPRTISAATATHYLQALKAERLGLAVAFTWALAVRPGEAAALRVSDIDLVAGTVTITGSHNRTRGTATTLREDPKSWRGNRVLPLPPPLAPWVQQHLARVQNERQAMAERWTAEDEGLLFVRESDGGRIHNGQVYETATRVAERMGLGKVGPRILRRSMLSLLAAGGVDPKVRAAIGGHTTAITELHYREVDPAEVDAAMHRLDDVLAPLADEEVD